VSFGALLERVARREGVFRLDDAPSRSQRGTLVLRAGAVRLHDPTRKPVKHACRAHPKLAREGRTFCGMIRLEAGLVQAVAISEFFHKERFQSVLACDVVFLLSRD